MWEELVAACRQWRVARRNALRMVRELDRLVKELREKGWKAPGSAPGASADAQGKPGEAGGGSEAHLER